MAQISRRAFLKLAAAGGGGALAGGFGVKFADRLTPHVHFPEDYRSGRWTLFATTCRECPAGCGMVLRHRDGRVVKSEGNPKHPVSRGGLCPRGQSAVQGLYDPDRLRQPLRRVGGSQQPCSWAEGLELLAARLARPGTRVAVMSSLVTGTLAQVLTDFVTAFPNESGQAGEARGHVPHAKRLLFYEPFNYEPLRQAHRSLFGLDVIPQYKLSRCRFVVGFAADFLETWVSPVEFATDFAEMRSDTASRFAYVGPRQSMTAANADDFVQVPPGAERWVALAMLDEVLHRAASRRSRTRNNELVPRIRELATRLGAAEAVARSGVSRERIAQLAELFINADVSVALAGPAATSSPLARDTALAAALLNLVAGQVGQTVDFASPHALSRAAGQEQIEQFLDGLTGDDVLILHDTNPAFTRPSSVARLRRGGMVVCLGTMPDESAELADLVLPIDSPLESWGEYEPYPHVHSLVQPTMARLHDTRPAGDILLAVAQSVGRPIGDVPPGEDVNFLKLLRRRWARLGEQLAAGQGEDGFWTESLRGGGRWTEPEPRPVSLQAADGLRFVPDSPSADGDKLALWAWPSVMLFDGRVANRGWLQEAPDPSSSITWGNCVDIHPMTAARFGLEPDDVVELASSAGKVEAPARLTDDVPPGVAALAIGQGHSRFGRNATGVGSNAFAVLAGDADAPFGLVALRRVGRRETPAYASATQDQHGRRIVQWIALSELRKLKWGDGEKLILPLPEGYDPDRDLYPPHEYAEHRWAMVMDLDRCIGCGACSVACYAENNIAVVGPERVRQGREMAWLKVVPYRKSSDSGRLGWLPLLCQQCDAAPCEPVCPVFAAVHSEEGLNAQIYNRCIGTRYCSNNCPYKVRRFNWADPKWPEPLHWQLNPEVTVRCRGVMEKCTFCIQRIREAEHLAKLENRPLGDGEIAPACAQSCPAGVIVFGDLLDPSSRVSQLTRNHPRRYHLLEQLNTKVAVTFLRRIDRTV